MCSVSRLVWRREMLALVRSSSALAEKDWVEVLASMAMDTSTKPTTKAKKHRKDAYVKCKGKGKGAKTAKEAKAVAKKGKSAAYPAAKKQRVASGGKLKMDAKNIHSRAYHAAYAKLKKAGGAGCDLVAARKQAGLEGRLAVVELKKSVAYQTAVDHNY